MAPPFLSLLKRSPDCIWDATALPIAPAWPWNALFPFFHASADRSGGEAKSCPPSVFGPVAWPPRSLSLPIAGVVPHLLERFRLRVWVAVGQVGDGLAVAKNSMGNLIALTIPSNGEYINQTTFLTSPDALETAQLKIWREEIVNVGVLTDGLQMLALNMIVGEPHKPFFLPLFEFVANAEDRILAKEHLMRFLSSDKITKRTDDDLTLVLAAFINS